MSNSADPISKYIRHEDGKWTVYSEAGKPMGTYDSEAGAKRRLQQIEYFKTRKVVDVLRALAYDLGKALTYSPPVGTDKPRPETGETPVITGRGQQARFPGNTSAESYGRGAGGGIGRGVGAYRT